MTSTALVQIEQQLTPLAPHFAEVLAGVMPPERLIRTVLVSVERTPKLVECNRQSLFNAAMSAAVLGLEVDGVTGQAFLIPFGNRAQLVIGYKGFNTLGARAGITISGEVVREGDEFDYDVGEGYVTHKPSLASARDRRIIAAWAKAKADTRPAIVTIMGIGDIETVKARSPGARKQDSPWNDPVIGFPAMASKTVKRRLARSTPLSVFQLGAGMDEAYEERGRHAWIGPDRQLQVEGDAIAPEQPSPQPTAAQLMSSQPIDDELLDKARELATGGAVKFNPWFKSLPAEKVEMLQPYQGELRQRMEAAVGEAPAA